MGVTSLTKVSILVLKNLCSKRVLNQFYNRFGVCRRDLQINEVRLGLRQCFTGFAYHLLVNFPDKTLCQVACIGLGVKFNLIEQNPGELG